MDARKRVHVVATVIRDGNKIFATQRGYSTISSVDAMLPVDEDLVKKIGENL